MEHFLSSDEKKDELENIQKIFHDTLATFQAHFQNQET